MMREITVSKSINAPNSAVWAVLADFPNIARWNSGIKASRATSTATEGVGATRHCDLSPAGELEETITEWQPEDRMVVRIDSTAKLPIKSGLATFTLEAGSDDTTATGIHYAYETKWGIVGQLMAPMLQGRLEKGFGGFLDDLETEAAKAGAS